MKKTSRTKNECGVTFNQWVKHIQKELQINYFKLGLIKKS